MEFFTYTSTPTSAAYAILAAFALLSLPGCDPKITPMMERWPISYSGHYPREQPVTVEAAYFATKYDTIEGFTRMAGLGVFPIIPKGAPWLPGNVRYIPVSLITYMRVYSYDFDSHFDEFRRIGYQRLYRLVAEKGEVTIYDDFLQCGSWKNKTVLVGPKDTIQLFRWFAFCSHFGNKRPLLLRFINKRYHVKLREKNFKTKQDMIQYILDKENALLLASPFPHKSSFNYPFRSGKNGYGIPVSVLPANCRQILKSKSAAVMAALHNCLNFKRPEQES